jgi:hypothetical protein
MSMRQYVTVVGFVAVLIGLALWFVPVEASSSRGTAVDCGSVAEPNAVGPALNDVYFGTSGSAVSCDDALGTRTGWVLGLAAVGLVVGVGARVTRPRRAAGNQAQSAAS